LQALLTEAYLFYDERDDRFIATKWSESDQAVPIGSLVKPFTALACLTCIPHIGGFRTATVRRRCWGSPEYSCSPEWRKDHSHRAAYYHCLTRGQVASEYDPLGKAAEEVFALYRWVTAQLELQPQPLAKLHV
jgi:hypothetical protein